MDFEPFFRNNADEKTLREMIDSLAREERIALLRDAARHDREVSHLIFLALEERFPHEVDGLRRGYYDPDDADLAAGALERAKRCYAVFHAVIEKSVGLPLAIFEAIQDLKRKEGGKRDPLDDFEEQQARENVKMLKARFGEIPPFEAFHRFLQTFGFRSYSYRFHFQGKPVYGETLLEKLELLNALLQQPLLAGTEPLQEPFDFLLTILAHVRRLDFQKARPK